MTKNPVGWFEIAVTDLKRATKFYEAVFGVKLTPEKMDEWDMAFFPMDHNGAGAAGALFQGKGYTPSKTGTIVYFMTGDIPATLAKVEQNGGKTIFPKKSIGQHGFIAWFEDCEGNTVALHSMK